VVGRSNIVGRPWRRSCSRTLPRECDGHRLPPRTRHIEQHTLQGDILIVAIGKPEFVTGDHGEPGAVVIDVGVNRVETPPASRATASSADVKFQEAKQVASAITPVPAAWARYHHDAAVQHRPGRSTVGARLDLFSAASTEGAWTVGEVTKRARAVIEAGLPPLWVRGEMRASGRGAAATG